MAGTGTSAVRDRLLAERKQPDVARPVNRGNGATAVRGNLTGKKLAEAARYLTSSRTALINWTKEAYANSDQIEAQLDHVQEVLAMADKIAELGKKTEFKARLFGV